VESETVVYRAEVTGMIGALADILVELRAIRRLLESGEEEEAEDDLDE
jgi:hypothetical protein